MMLPNNSTMSSVRQCCAPSGNKRERDAEQAVEAEFFQHAGVQHRGGRGRGGIGFRRPGVKREERNQNAETDQEKEENLVLRAGQNAAVRRHRLQSAQVETAQFSRDAAVEQDQAEEQNEAAEPEIDRDLPGRGGAVARAPDADEQKSRDQRQLVEGVEEKQIERSKGADRAARDEEEAGVKEPLAISRSAA